MVDYSILLDRVYEDGLVKRLGCRFYMLMHPDTFHGGLELYLCSQRYRCEPTPRLKTAGLKTPRFSRSPLIDTRLSVTTAMSRTELLEPYTTPGSLIPLYRKNDQLGLS